MPRKSQTPEQIYKQALKLAMSQDPDPDLDKVARMLEKAHEGGVAEATYALATWYLFGKHFRKNWKKGNALLRIAAEKRHPEALYNLGISYELGKGLKKNEKVAASLYFEAALLGDRDGLEDTARCFYHGIGVEKDRLFAKAIFRHLDSMPEES